MTAKPRIAARRRHVRWRFRRWQQRLPAKMRRRILLAALLLLAAGYLWSLRQRTPEMEFGRVELYHP